MKLSLKLHGLIFFLFTSQVYATQHLEKLWSYLTINGSDNQLVYYVEPQIRFVYLNTPFQQFLTNMGLGWKIDSSWQLWGGQTFSADSQDALPGSQDEYRLWQQISWRKSMFNQIWHTRTRVEERHSLYFAPWSYRLRQRINMNHPLTDNLTLLLSDEIFFNLNHTYWIITQTLDQNRAYIGLEQKLTKKWFVAFGYLNQTLTTKIPQVNQVVVVNFRYEIEGK